MGWERGRDPRERQKSAGPLIEGLCTLSVVSSRTLQASQRNDCMACLGGQGDSHSCVCMYAQRLSIVRLFVTPWTVARKVPLSIEFSRQEYWSMLPFPTPGHLPDPGIESVSLVSHALAGRVFTTPLPGKPG